MRVAAAVVLLALVAGRAPLHAVELGEFPVTEAATVQGSLALGGDANSGRYLVVWADSRNGSADLDIHARLLDPDGSARASEFPLAAARRGQAFPALAFDPGRDRFLVVWTDWRDAYTVESDIYGRFVTAGGTAGAAPFPIAKARISQKFPAIGFDVVRQRYLVVWADRRHGPIDALYGQFLAAGGSLQGPEFRIAASPGDQQHHSVVFDRNQGRFLVVWWAPDDAAIRAAFVEGPGTAAHAPFDIAARGDPRLASNLAAAFAPEANRYLVVWSADSDRTKAGLDVYGTLIDAATGAAIGRPVPIATGAGREQSAVVAYDPKGRRFLVVWLERRRNPDVAELHVQGRFVGVDGRPGDAVPLSDPAAIGPKRSPAIAYSPQSETFLVIWEDGRDAAAANRRIYGRAR